MVNSSRIHTLLISPEKATASDVSLLQDIIQEYPYFQIAHILLAKVIKETTKNEIKDYIYQAALHATSRVKLKQFLFDTPSKANSSIISSVPEVFKNEFLDFINKNHLKTNIDKQNKSQQQQLLEKFIYKTPIIKPISLDNTEKTDKKIDLSEKSSKINPKIATERLGKIMWEQGEKSYAIAIFHQLKLKFPKKSAYFASVIEQIKKQP